MRRVLDDSAYSEWADRFLPSADEFRGSAFLESVDVAEDEDGIALHFVGLNVAKAWSLAAVAEELDGEQATLFAESAERHLEAGVGMAFTDEYAGSHWLSSFVVYLLTRAEGGIGL